MDRGILNIITPCTRPYNLVKMSESIKAYAGWQVNWYIIFDTWLDTSLPWQILTRLDIRVHKWYVPTFGNGTVGHDQRNRALDLIERGYMYQLDDDNLMHPNFENALEVASTPPEPVVIFNQVHKDGTPRLQASPENTKPHSIDNAQFLVPRAYIDDLRYELVYHGDGLFIDDLYRASDTGKNKPFVWMNQNLSFYNALR